MTTRTKIWGILILGFLVKVPTLFRPFLGYFSSYQTMNAMFAVMMQRGHWFDIRSFLLMNGQPSLHLIYFPFASFFAALLQLSTHISMDFCGRFQSAVCVMVASVLFWKSLNNLFNAPKENRMIILSLVFFTFSPMILLSGISFQNESPALLFLMCSVCLLSGFSEKPLQSFFAGLFFSLALSARMHFVFIFPSLAFLLIARYFSIKRVLLFMVGSLVPVCSWYGYTYYLQGIYPQNVITSLFSQVGEHRILKESLLFNSKFYFQVLKTVGGKMLTPVASLAFVWGVLRAPRNFDFFRLWFLGALATILILPQKVFDHAFYIVAAVPPAAVFTAYTLGHLWDQKGGKIPSCFFVVFFLLCFRYYIPPAFSNDIHLNIPLVGREIQKLVPENAYVIAEKGTTPDLLYYIDRYGWTFDLDMEAHPLEDQPRYASIKALGYGDLIQWLEKLRDDGARYLAITNIDLFKRKINFFNYVSAHYRLIEHEYNDFYLFDLGASAV